MSRKPAVPVQNKSPKGTGDAKPASTDHEMPPEEAPDKQGQQANTKQNTTHQGYQQAR